jgi:hypothetical protein
MVPCLICLECENQYGIDGPKSPRGGTPLSLVKRIGMPTHRSHHAGGAIWPSKVPLLDDLVSEAVGTNGPGEELWRARGDAIRRYRWFAPSREMVVLKMRGAAHERRVAPFTDAVMIP